MDKQDPHSMQRVIAPDDVDPATHLATDEALLLAAEAGESGPTIRFWHFDRPTVVLGRSSRVDFEINRDFCDAHHIPILRRCSGGASVVGGPGCLMYSVVLAYAGEPELQKIDVAHRYVMSRVLRASHAAIDDAVRPDVMLQGICDLTLVDRKCSGNSLRMARRHVLYHGTILYDFDLELLSNCLAGAPRQPDYRRGRAHDSFVTNLPMDSQRFITAMCDQFAVAGTLPLLEGTGSTTLRHQIEQLKVERYDQASWHFRH